MEIAAHVVFGRGPIVVRVTDCVDFVNGVSH